jgi:hypothetical protein
MLKIGPAFLLAALFLSLPAVGHAFGAEVMEVRSRPITQFRIGREERRFGPLEFVGGLEMVSPARNFGSFSAFRFRDAGHRFIGVADTGFWFSGRIERDGEGRPAGVADFVMTEMVDRRGLPIRAKWETDAEGLALSGDRATVSFERAHRLAVFDVGGPQIGGPLAEIDFVIPRHELRRNKGIETVAHAPEDGPLAGARIVISERSIDRKGDIFAAVIEGPLRGVFTVRRRGSFDITDGAFLPGGDLILLERAFSIGEGVRLRLRRIPAGMIRPGAVADGPVLVEADMAYQIDNMEGLDIWQREDGAVMIALMSDDNHSILQRNLYLEFRLTGE